ncbi:MAG: tRNA (N6-isopentenyl adenosine(37)-C2)-methylthiotransferase MiaB [Alphaproteobacteria bacterium]|jgi:tRNA-2-methylthio-N6-dimethylallyladenosine synthase|nr:tRNA (N6-isopentenyl adenosine(37)-C2)-methylthiotransferase MiaB [Alphaproteobacteria bacterium]
MKKIYIKTYGCQMNVYDSERMYELMKPHGYRISENYEDSDLIILNTCHIREKAAEKIYSELGRIVPFKEDSNKRGKQLNIVVAGCVAQAEGKEIIKRQPMVDVVVGPQTYHRLPEILNRLSNKSRKIIDTDFPIENKFDELKKIRTNKNPVAFLSIQEGCDKFCSFCVVPYTRGAEYSRPVLDIISEAKNLIQQGAKEICLLGQNVNAYHGDYRGRTLSLDELIKEVANLSGIKRIRYMTSHPVDMTEGLIDAHGKVDKLMPYIHLPVQSGDNNVLKSMNRKYSAENYIKIIDKLKNVREDMAFSSDFIVGFPGETKQAFNNTLKLVHDVNYCQAYSFKYSRRPGTPGSILQGQVPEEIKTERLAELQGILNEQQLNFNRKFIGQKFDILLERNGKKDNQLVGKSPYMQAVHVISKDHKIGDIIKTHILDADKNSLEGNYE